MDKWLDANRVIAEDRKRIINELFTFVKVVPKQETQVKKEKQEKQVCGVLTVKGSHCRVFTVFGPCQFHARVEDRTCSVAGCERPHKARGFCIMHYKRWDWRKKIGSNIPLEVAVVVKNHKPKRVRIK